MRRAFPLVILVFGLTASAMLQGDPIRFHLDLNRSAPKAGDEGDLTIRQKSITVDTKKDKSSFTNSFEFLELKGRERIVAWNVTNDTSKVELVVDHLVDVKNGQTNEWLRPGNRLMASSILSEMFLRSVDRSLPNEALQRVASVYDIRPRFFNQFAGTKIPTPVSIGDTWEFQAPQELRAMSALGVSLTKEVKATGRLLGKTNLFGFDCLRVQLRIEAPDSPEFGRQLALKSGLPITMNVQVALTVELVVPVDMSQRILSAGYFFEIGTSTGFLLGDQPSNLDHSQMMSSMVFEYRPVPDPH